MTRIGAATVLCAAAAAVGGCAGVAPPSAPLHEAARLGVATSDISTACGEMTQLQAFPPPPPHDVTTLEATAASAARKLAGVYRRNPNWLYEGASVHTIVRQAVAMLDGCGLATAARTLRLETSGRG